MDEVHYLRRTGTFALKSRLHNHGHFCLALRFQLEDILMDTSSHETNYRVLSSLRRYHHACEFKARPLWIMYVYYILLSFSTKQLYCMAYILSTLCSRTAPPCPRTTPPRPRTTPPRSRTAPPLFPQIAPRLNYSDGCRILDTSFSGVLLLISHTHFSAFPYFQPIINS